MQRAPHPVPLVPPADVASSRFHLLLFSLILFLFFLSPWGTVGESTHARSSRSAGIAPAHCACESLAECTAAEPFLETVLYY